LKAAVSAQPCDWSILWPQRKTTNTLQCPAFWAFWGDTERYSVYYMRYSALYYKTGFMQDVFFWQQAKASVLDMF
jgi:hypothetical protein